MAQTQIHFIQSLPSIRLPHAHIVIGDRTLPPAIRKNFPQAIWVSPGEKLKSCSALEKLAKKVLARKADRSLTLAALGGGSVGDAVGFLSSILWRGVRLVHIPTTLLAMADSAHGGKTAVNLAGAKNQLGTFYPASDVWICEEILKKLPSRVIREGWAEIIKSALLGDRTLASRLFRHGIEGVSLFAALRSAIAVKRKVIRRDPFEERGHREILNLGHTLGHALEATTSLSHGQAVAWGLCAAARISIPFGYRDADSTLGLLRSLLVSPRSWPTRKRLLKTFQFDKKTKRGLLRSVVLKGIGKPHVTTSLTPSKWVTTFEQIRTERSRKR